jgi:hypothetical protein
VTWRRALVAGSSWSGRGSARAYLPRGKRSLRFFDRPLLRCNKNLAHALDSRSGGDYCALQQMLHRSKSAQRHTRRAVVTQHRPPENPMSTQDVMNTYKDLTNQNVERLNALGELNLKVAEKMVSRQMDAMNLFMEQGVRMLKLATEAKGYGELYKGQVEMAKEMSEQLMAESKTNMALAGEIRDDYRGWFDAAMAELKDGNTAVRNAVTA